MGTIEDHAVRYLRPEAVLIVSSECAVDAASDRLLQGYADIFNSVTRQTVNDTIHTDVNHVSSVDSPTTAQCADGTSMRQEELTHADQKDSMPSEATLWPSDTRVLVKAWLHAEDVSAICVQGRLRRAIWERETRCEESEFVSDTSVRCKVGQRVSWTLQAEQTAGEVSGSVTKVCSVNVTGRSTAQGVQGMNLVPTGLKSSKRQEPPDPTFLRSENMASQLHNFSVFVNSHSSLLIFILMWSLSMVALLWLMFFLIIYRNSPYVIVAAQLYSVKLNAAQCRRRRRHSAWSVILHLSIFTVLTILGSATVRAASFTTKAIGQSTPVPGATNTITVTLVSDTALTAAANSAVTISGLSGASASASVNLLDAGNDGETIFSDGTDQSKGSFSTGTLTLFLYTGQTLAAGTTYTFGFEITNPSGTSTSPTINIAASGSATIASTAMNKPGTSIFGVSNGADPLTVVVPAFSTKTIQQSTPVAGLVNTVSVTLVSNYNLATGSSVTIFGLRETSSLDENELQVISTDGKLGANGVWTQNSGRLVLSTASGGIVSGTAYSVSFDLYNPDLAQSSPDVHIQAVISDGSSDIGSIAAALMTKPGTALHGIANGQDPLTVVNQEIQVYANVATVYSKQVTVIASKTGLYGQSGKTRIQSTACEETIWNSDTQAVCKAPAGMFATRKAIVTIGTNAVPGTISQAISYDGPTISSKSENRVRTGSGSVTVHGAGMGLVSVYTGRAREGQTGCEATEWESETSVRCQVSEGGRGTWG